MDNVYRYFNAPCLISHYLLFLLVAFSCSEFTILCFGDVNPSVKCIQTEREALIALKKDLTDPSGRLSSWVGEDCCTWSGVVCNNRTGHIAKLNLRNPVQFNEEKYEFDPSTYKRSCLGGKLSPSLLHLKSLNYLDLSSNDFHGTQIPKFIGLLKNLKYLNLSHSSFGGEIPPHLGNLSNLHYLDLHSCFTFLRNPQLGPSIKCFLGIHAGSLQWLSHLSSLKHLNLVGVNLSVVGPDWLQEVNLLPSLVELHLSHCKLQNPQLLVPLINLTSLSVLDLSRNSFNSSMPHWLSNLTSLEKLDLSVMYLEGTLPNSLGLLKNLQYLDLSSNKMNGSIPESFGQLLELVHVDLTENSWEGVLTESHLINLTKLEDIAITTDSPMSLIFNVTYEWLPPFKLKSIFFDHCWVGPSFAMWLQTQSELTDVVLRNAGISDIIPEVWFSKLSSQITRLDLYNNQIKGNLPHQLEFPKLETYIDLGINLFEGPIPNWATSTELHLFLDYNLFSGPFPQNLGELMPRLKILYLSENHLNGSIPSSVCRMQSLMILSLRSNQFSGELPDCWNDMGPLYVVDISNNNLSGHIPTSMGFLKDLLMLSLSDNNLDGKIPSSLQNCSEMIHIDLGGNKLSGNLPLWIGEKLSNLLLLRLRSNMFGGHIPQQLCNLPYLHILDLSHNNLSGSIPKCFGNLSALVNSSDAMEMYKQYTMFHSERTKVTTKGKELEYNSTLIFVNIIDLSGNNLIGGIPDEISNLFSLGILNLSMNHLNGSIPEKIGNLRWLETLDLSSNHLSGPIPQSLSSLTFLTNLNLSHNDLVGRIPSGNQLQTLNDPSIYEGNPLLCGDPLQTKCPGDGTSKGPTSSINGKDGDDFERLWLYVSIALGFIVGFWGVCGTLVVKKSWRQAYFQFVDDMKDKISLMVELKLARLRRKIGLEKV